jgi:hypothetical protein
MSRNIIAAGILMKIIIINTNVKFIIMSRTKMVLKAISFALFPNTFRLRTKF